MSDWSLADAVARDAEADPAGFCESCSEYGPGPAERDRRELLALVRELRTALSAANDEIARLDPYCQLSGTDDGLLIARTAAAGPG